MKRDYVIEYNCGIDEELCFNTADAFLDVGMYCNEYDKRAQAESILFACDAFYAIPAIVNIAFACELYLKALILRETSKPSRGHNLSALYDKIPTPIRNIVENQFENKCKNPVSLLETLEIHKNSFDNWRYIHEHKNKDSEAYLDNLILAAEVLRNELERKKLKH